jgi:hypothetical protein
MPQLGREPGVGDEPARLPGVILGHEHPPRKSADRAFEHADMPIGDEHRDVGMLQKRLHEAEHHDVVRADDLDHGFFVPSLRPASCVKPRRCGALPSVSEHH